jgi:hypothetical protein
MSDAETKETTISHSHGEHGDTEKPPTSKLSQAQKNKQKL